MRGLITVLLSIASGPAFGQLPVTADSIYSVIKQRSIYRKEANWKSIDEEFKARLIASRTAVDSIKSLVYIFEQLGDVHSSIAYKGRQYGNYPVFDDSLLKRLSPLVKESSEQTGIIRSKVISGDYGYVQIPSIIASGNGINEYAQAISDSICALTAKNVKGFIIDLRLDGGGQLSAMISGLNMLLGNVYLGGGTDAEGVEKNRFEIKNRNFCINGNPETFIQNKCGSDIRNQPVVVLIGPVTRSSGSIVAIAFKKRANTHFAGEPTAEGYTTGNDYFFFGNDLNMNLSTCYSHDREKTLYKDAVNPDEMIIEGDNFYRLQDDLKIIAAIKWIENSDR